MTNRKSTHSGPRRLVLGLASALADRNLFFASLIALLALTLAYQFRLPFSIALGGPTDGMLLRDFETPQYDQQAGTPFRWTTGSSSVYLQGWGAGNPIELRVRLTRWRPGERIANLTIYVNRLDLAQPEASGQGWQEYAIRVADPRFLASDDLSITFQTDTFVPKLEIPGNPDPRRLGIQVGSVTLTPLVNRQGNWRAEDGLIWSPFKLPPLWLTLEFMACALVIYCGLALFRVPRHFALTGAVMFSISSAVALVWARPYLAPFSGSLLGCLLAALAGGLLARVFVPSLFRWGGVVAGDEEVNLLAFIFAFALIVRLVMLLYPQTISADLAYHVHRLQDVLGGTLFWSHPSTKGEFGGNLAPYLPSYYVFLAPLAGLAPLQLLIQLSGIFLDAATIFLIYYLLKKHFDAGRAGILGAWVYIAVPLGFIALSWGIYPSLFGQLLTLLLVVAVSQAFDQLTTLRAFVVVTLLFGLTLLSHPGVFASVVVLFAVWTPLLFILGRMWRARSFWALMVSIALSAVAAFLLYYSEFASLMIQGTSSILASSTETGTSAGVGSSLTLWQLLQPTRTEFTAVPLYIYVLAVLGIGLLLYQTWRAFNQGRFLLLTLLTAWLATFVFLMVLRAEYGSSPRYVNFVMPAVALSAGVALASIYGRGWAGRAISLGVCLLLVAQGLDDWFILIMYKYH